MGQGVHKWRKRRGCYFGQEVIHLKSLRICNQSGVQRLIGNIIQ